MTVGTVHRTILDFWWTLPRTGGQLPTRETLDPAAFPEILPYLALIEPLPGKAGLKYRLVGTAVATCLGQDPTGQSLQTDDQLTGDLKRWSFQALAEGDLVSGTSRLNLPRHFNPLGTSHPFTLDGAADVSILLLPFSGGLQKPRMILAAFDLAEFSAQTWHRAFAPNSRSAAPTGLRN